MAQMVINPTVKDYKSEVKPTWCPGCGDFGVLNATFRGLASMKLALDQTVVVSGIGCSSRFPHFMKTFGFHSVHGRALPVAQGLKMARPDLNVVTVGGDGDFFSIGAGHLVHAALRNIDITVVVMDNEIYGLTKGQTSPTSPHGHVTKSTPYGLMASQFNPVATVLSLNVGFVARGYSAKPKDLAALIEQGINYKGFAFIHALSPCPTFYHTFDAWDAAVTPIPTDHDTSDRSKAIALSMEMEKPYIGLFYREERPTMDEAARQLAENAKPFNIEDYMKRYA
ncbi:MAG: 2-oxoacid:ferredoxin oxidoreductase subunit beta [Ktedonobacteraceae bacterium]|jgi:2-oxoglutarate/2-oxoacid ferredoxin oxidoreductase subunit beta|nr:2-oxoacid:ferredoxin oxidoreductase subunit beta [Ktedonobacteraceae bacterium]MBO0791758.1 2-oxoacid:ferredoxin oxidoreductase subunit beta [Ktedonobacteraceae bacterium]